MSNLSQISVVLTFKSITDISRFKKECSCTEFYIDRDALTLVGIFSEDQIQLATTQYGATLQAENK